MDKDTKLRAVLFFVIGFLLVLSLIICIYIVAGERKLKPIEATVVSLASDAKGHGSNAIQISYDVEGTSYFPFIYTKKHYDENDTIKVYYFADKPDQVKTSKTSKLIFLCPVLGLVLCALGVFELFRRSGDGEDEFKTSVIGVVGNTQQLKIVTDNAETASYTTIPEEKAEVEVKMINKPVAEDIPQQLDAVSELTDAATVLAPQPDIVLDPVPEPVVEPIPDPVPEPVSEPVVEPILEPIPEPVQEVSTKPIVEHVATVIEPEPAPVIPDINNVEEASEEETPKEEKSSNDGLEAALIEKVKQKNGEKIEVSEEELKEAIKDVLADVIKEVKQEKTKKEVVQVRVIPNYYYISGTSLMYEEAGKEQKELDLKEVKSVVRTINEAGVVVKLVVESPEVKCILTNMKNIDLEQLANLLRNKMRAMDENFEEVIEHKEY